MKLSILCSLLLLSSIGFAKTQSAIYEVPGFNGSNESRFPVSYKVEQIGSQVSVDYELPTLLTGAQNRIRAEGTMVSPSMAVLKGPNSNLTCDMPNKVCNVVFKNLAFDLGALKDELTRSGVSGQELEKRMAVALKFSGDPEGVIRYGSPY